MLLSDLVVIEENPDFFVFQKPVGLVVNTSETSSTNTLQDYLDETYTYYADKSTVFGQRSGIVHRLDKDTSGLLLVAKNEVAFEALTDLFKTKNIHKEYYAVVHNKLEQGSVEINLPLQRNPQTRTKFGISSDGRLSITKVINKGSFILNDHVFSLVLALPLTGRTHQIRVHMASINHPIAGDVLYTGKNLSKVGQELFGRMMLHAHKLTFLYNDKTYTFESHLPKAFAQVLELV